MNPLVRLIIMTLSAMGFFALLVAEDDTSKGVAALVFVLILIFALFSNDDIDIDPNMYDSTVS